MSLGKEKKGGIKKLASSVGKHIFFGAPVKIFKYVFRLTILYTVPLLNDLFLFYQEAN